MHMACCIHPDFFKPQVVLDAGAKILHLDSSCKPICNTRCFLFVTTIHFLA